MKGKPGTQRRWPLEDVKVDPVSAVRAAAEDRLAR